MQALQTFDAADPLVRDESIPFQIFPQPGQFDRWLIPLGRVRWHPSAVSTQPGKFEARDQDDKAQSRLLRRYIGLVTEEIHAPAGFVRVRDRTQPYNDSEPRTDDLLWVDGKLRAGGDVRLFGSLLSVLNSDGDDEGVPLRMQRGERTAVGGKALQIQIGAAKDGKNALEIGPADTAGAFTPKLVVLDNGNVGIGTSQPASTLEVSGGETLLRGGDLVLKATAEDPGDVIFQNSAGNQKGRIWSNPLVGAALHLSSGDNSPDLTIDSVGNVGIGINAPKVQLHIESTDPTNHACVIQSSPSPGPWVNQLALTGSDVNAEARLGFATTFADGNSHHTAIIKTVVPTGGGGDLVFQTREPAFAGINERMRITNTGQVGIGTTTPGAKLDVAGSFRLNGGTVLAKIQGGTATMGISGSPTKTVNVIFPTSFAGIPKVIALARGGNFPDVFALTTTAISPTSFTIRVRRLDTLTGWGQNLQLDWLAWE
jgi:hypothetical protein